MSQNKNYLNDKERAIFKLFFTGGLQRYFARDEAQIYLNNLLLDSVKFCVKDFSANVPTSAERDCVKSFVTKNYQLLNGNLENLQ